MRSCLSLVDDKVNLSELVELCVNWFENMSNLKKKFSMRQLLYCYTCNDAILRKMRLRPILT